MSLVAVFALAALWTQPAAGQGFKPTRPVDVVVHTGPGGGNDVLARFIVSAIEREKLVPVRMQVVNKPGGAGLTQLSYLIEKRGDPHTIGTFSATWITNTLMREEARATAKDVTPLVRLALEPAVIVVKSDAPYRTLKDFTDAAKQAPGQLKQSGGSIGSRDWLMRQLIGKYTGAQWAYISFPGGGERIAALLGGHVQMMVIEPQEAGEHIRAGNMRVLAQIADKRLPGFPNAPTLKEAGFDIRTLPVVRGMVTPPGVAPDVVAYWEDVFVRLAKTATWKKYLEDNQFEDGFQRSAEFAKFIDSYTEEMRTELTGAGVKLVR